MNTFKIGDIEVGGGNFILLAGPCVLEGYERSLKIGRRAKEIADKLKIPYRRSPSRKLPTFYKFPLFSAGKPIYSLRRRKPKKLSTSRKVNFFLPTK